MNTDSVLDKTGSIGLARATDERYRMLIIVPAFNEEGSVAAVIANCRRCCSRASVVVIDDGSTDRTAEIAKSSGAAVVSLPFNTGIGGGMQTGYLYAKRLGFDIAVQLDGDGQHDPSQIRSLVEPILAGSADLVVGSRFRGTVGFKSTAARRVGIIWLSKLVSLLAHQTISDPTSGFRAANRKVIEYFAMDYPTDYPEPETIVSLSKSRFRTVEVPVSMHERHSGRSSITLIRSVYYMVKVTLAIMIEAFRDRDASRR